MIPIMWVESNVNLKWPYKFIRKLRHERHVDECGHAHSDRRRTTTTTYAQRFECIRLIRRGRCSDTRKLRAIAYNVGNAGSQFGPNSVFEWHFSLFLLYLKQSPSFKLGISWRWSGSERDRASTHLYTKKPLKFRRIGWSEANKRCNRVTKIINNK